MIPKTIVCPVAADATVNKLSAVVALCERHEAHLVVPMIELEPPPPIAVEAPVSDIWVEHLREVNTHVAEKSRSLEESLHATGLSAEVHGLVCPIHQVSHQLGVYGRLADLGIASTSMRESEDIRSQAIFGLLFESSGPVLVESANKNAVLTLTPQTVLVAWDGGLPVSRSVAHAIELLKAAGTVHLACIDPKAPSAARGLAPGRDLASYLSRHGVNVTVSEIPSGGQDIDVVLGRHAIEVGAECLVMGAYGHSRLREKLLGGTTRAVLAQSDVTVLMAH